MRKLFLFLCAALMSVGMYATTEVTITQSDFGGWDESFTKGGVTVSASMIDPMDGNLMQGGSFTSSVGNFTQIEVTAADVYMLSGEGWSGNSQKKTWTGNASSVSFNGNIMGLGMGVTLKFTIEEPAAAVTGVTLNQNEAQMTVGGETLTLIATVNPDNATDKSVTWSTSDANVATVENGVVTAVAAGTATITVTTTDGSFTATCDVTVTTPEPEPEPEPATTYNVTFTDINSNVKVVENITLPHTFSCDYTNGNGELDLIIQEFYNEPGGHCATNGWPWGGNNNEVVVDHDGNNHFVTINAPFIGTSFMSGYYDGINDGNFYYTFHITIAASTPEPEPQPSEDVDIIPNVDPDHAGVYYSTFYDSQIKYALPAGVEAYVATRDGANLLLSKIADAGQTIPADNAVILKSSVTPFTLSISDADAVPVNAINHLEGSDESIATPANCYVLAGNDGVGFYHYTASMLNPHKAYVIYSGSNQAPKRMPFIFDQATGVENVQGDNVQSTKVIENGVLYIIKNGVKYNAQGQVIK